MYKYKFIKDWNSNGIDTVKSSLSSVQKLTPTT